jgi:hypothetical protein
VQLSKSILPLPRSKDGGSNRYVKLVDKKVAHKTGEAATVDIATAEGYESSSNYDEEALLFRIVIAKQLRMCFSGPLI